MLASHCQEAAAVLVHGQERILQAADLIWAEMLGHQVEQQALTAWMPEDECATMNASDGRLGVHEAPVDTCGTEHLRLTLNLDMAVNCLSRVSMTDDIGRSGRLAMFRILQYHIRQSSSAAQLLKINSWCLACTRAIMPLLTRGASVPP